MKFKLLNRLRIFLQIKRKKIITYTCQLCDKKETPYHRLIPSLNRWFWVCQKCWRKELRK